MLLRVTPLAKDFCAEIGGVDFNAPLNRSVVTDLRDAFNTYSVLVIRDQPMDDDQQVVFSKYFGRPEGRKGANPAAARLFHVSLISISRPVRLSRPMIGVCFIKRAICFGIWTVPSRCIHRFVRY